MKTTLILIALLFTSVLFAQPANDFCSNATDIFDGDCLNGTLTDGDDNLVDETSCGTDGNDNQHIDVWYSFVATGTSIDLTVDNFGANGEMEVVLLNGTCGGSLGELACSSEDVADLAISYGSLTIGDTYFILVSHSKNREGNFEICVNLTSPPPISSNTDAATATALCSSSTFAGNSNGSGVQELNSTNQGCLGIENQSSWYTFTIETSGDLKMTIAPDASDDYDFAIWGPNPTLPLTIDPIRCSYAAEFDDTGMGNSATDNTEDSFGDGWVAPMNVLAGEVYIVLIDNYSSSSNPFSLSWGGTAGMDCSVVLPVELVHYKGESINGANYITWETLTEINNDYFSLERSDDLINFEEIAVVQGNGNSTELQEYSFLDREILNETYYYRLKQVDFDGASAYSKIISIDGEENVKLVKIVNVMGQVVNENTQGIKFYVYDNGMIDKRY